VTRAAAGLIIAAGIAALARRASSLSITGALAAVVVGVLAMAAGWDWGLLLIAFFVSSSALSRTGSEVKEARAREMLVKYGARDAAQVAANGGLFALAALLFLLDPWAGWRAAGIGALAGATADTWGTEIGMLSGREPRSITTWQRVTPGQSGGVTPIGMLATLGGGLFIGALSWLLGWDVAIVLAGAIGGFLSAVADSVMGALWQERRHCPRCDVVTERSVHHCGAPTEHAAGAAWLDNDGVNALAGVLGAGVAIAVWRLLS
jgi:uncharacterized protein (TIGR00297 family)